MKNKYLNEKDDNLAIKNGPVFYVERYLFI